MSNICKQSHRRKRLQGGFSLVELMVVVAIIGVLSNIVSTKVHSYRARAARSEAKSNLYAIRALQEGYHISNGTYASLPLQGRLQAVVSCTANDLGFHLNPCNKTVRYGYFTIISTNLNFEAVARSGSGANNLVYKDCAQFDELGLHDLDGPAGLHFHTDTVRLCQ
jgi:prepilin-type N-terminal cleavage/methylation domain-containing protein